MSDGPAIGRRSLVSRIARRLARELAEWRLLGTGAIRHHLARGLGQAECRAQIAGVGPVALRPLQPDLVSFTRIFGDREYAIPVAAARAAIRSRYEAILACGAIPVVVDAGAYIGASSLWFGSTYPRARIVAIEPEPTSFALLQRNLQSLDGAVAIEAAVGAEPGEVRLVPACDSWGTQVDRSGSGVKVVTMNEAFASVVGGQPFLAKINIEGFEQDVFSANLEWLDEISVLFIEPHDWLFPGQSTSRAFQKALGERDFHLFIVGPHLCYARL